MFPLKYSESLLFSAPLCWCCCVCKHADSLSYDPLNIIHPYYILLFLIMIYLPRRGFIKIDTPVPRELPACSPSFLLKQQSLTFLPSHNKPHGLASAEGLGLACTKVMHPAFVQHCGPIPLQHQWELLVAAQEGITALPLPAYSSASPFSSCLLEEIH